MNEEITPSSFRQDTKMHNAPFVFLFLQHLKKYPASTLICTDSDNSADLLHRAGQELGVEIPGKIALTGFGDVTHLPIATVNQNPERQGELAARHLIDRNEDPSLEVPREELVETSLVNEECIPILFN